MQLCIQPFYKKADVSSVALWRRAACTGIRRIGEAVIGKDLRGTVGVAGYGTDRLGPCGWHECDADVRVEAGSGTWPLIKTMSGPCKKGAVSNSSAVSLMPHIAGGEIRPSPWRLALPRKALRLSACLTSISSASI
ncbi:MAG: hypothetical protein WB392_10565 [Methanotrichaceae archaeon]